MAETQTIKCTKCGKDIQQLSGNQKFCAACGAKARKYRPRRKTPIVIRCAVCGKEIETTTGKTKYCRECAYKVQRQQIAASGKTRERCTLQTCLQCGKKFFTQSAKYCSQQCRNEAVKKAKEQRGRSKTLDDWIHEATECNLDYGTYRALRYMGKTFEELKATAGDRPIQAHNRNAKSLIGS
ncbi:MAG: hypothetical protein J5497_02445 [Selenomonadaceae bacterium]|nr:hypothetical protein [Selenomonadaceae bacterium]